MKVGRDKSGININGLTRREVWSLKSAIERELKFATEYNRNKKVNNIKNLELHIEILENLLSKLNTCRSNTETIVNILKVDLEKKEQCVCWSEYGKSLNIGIKCSNCGREL